VAIAAPGAQQEHHGWSQNKLPVAMLTDSDSTHAEWFVVPQAHLQIAYYFEII
jgi:hypothetical protein